MLLKVRASEFAKSSQPVVFWSSLGLAAAFVAWGVAFKKQAAAIGAELLAAITHNFGWQLCLTVTGLLLFSLFIGLSPWGAVRLGEDDERPEFSTSSWFAMLFSAGMGIGMLFYGVAEPLIHYGTPPDAEPLSAEAARDAMGITMFHWGLHAWAIYTVVALALAYPAFRLKQPLSIRSTLRPVFGRWMDGTLGHAVDILAVFATLFGLATSLGLGARQINGGLNRVFGVEISATSQVLIIVVVTLIATVSVVTGIKAGIRRLSELNVLVAVALVIFVFLSGPTLELLGALLTNSQAYLTALLTRSVPGELNDWYADWTLFYWAWWIAWSPFVGMFVARISRGRTIREMVWGVLAVPTLVGIVWFTVFGSTAMQVQRAGEVDLLGVVQKDPSLAVFALLEQLPAAAVLMPLTILLVATFFVTSSDSGSLVVDMLTSGGNINPPMWQRVFWALTEGAIAATLLVMGGLKALQSAAISVGLPFSFIILLMAWGIVRQLRAEARPARASGERPAG